MLRGVKKTKIRHDRHTKVRQLPTTQLKTIAIYPKRADVPQAWVDALIADLAKAGFNVSVVPRDDAAAAERMVKATDIVLAFGGDGTFLAAARLAAPCGKPVLGVNLGTLGFLAEYEQSDWPAALADLVAGRLKTEPRMMLRCELNDQDLGWALNDVVINKGALARMITVDLRVNGEAVARFRADGLIVATPVGSTAYNLSAGGPIVYPHTDVIAITPICPHHLNVRPLIVSPDAVIELDIENPAEACHLTLDGQVGHPLPLHSRVLVARAPLPLRLVRGPQRSFFGTLTQKLGWADSGKPGGG